MKLAFFRDEDGWGLGLYVAALNKGVDAYIFDDDESLADIPPDCVLFVRMSHKEAVRERYKGRIETWGRIHKIVPGRTLGKLYDDKIAQQERLSAYMPQSFIVKDEDGAYMAMRHLTMPFVSKAYSGAGSKGVRLITSSEEAIKDLNTRRKEEGPLVWQRFCADNAYDLRCLIVGKERLWIKRMNRDNVPFASGSGRVVPLKPSEVPRRTAEFVERFILDQSGEAGIFGDTPMPFLGVDLINMDGKPVLTEITTSWTLPVYFSSVWQDGRKGHAFFDIVVEQMVQSK